MSGPASPCLSPDEVIDLLDDRLPPARAGHVARCARCAATVAALRDASALVADVDVPEPSPLFWTSINARVQGAIAEGRPAPWSAWLRWDVLTTVAGLGIVLVALGTAVERSADEGRRRGLAATAGALTADTPVSGRDDAALGLMMDLAGTLPEGAWDALGVSTLPDLGVVAAALTDDERRALAALLTTALDRPAS